MEDSDKFKLASIIKLKGVSSTPNSLQIHIFSRMH